MFVLHQLVERESQLDDGGVPGLRLEVAQVRFAFSDRGLLQRFVRVRDQAFEPACREHRIAPFDRHDHQAGLLVIRHAEDVLAELPETVLTRRHVLRVVALPALVGTVPLSSENDRQKVVALDEVFDDGA